MENKSGFTVVALGFIFAGMIVMFVAFYNPSIVIRTPQDIEPDTQTTATQTYDDAQPKKIASPISASADLEDINQISYPININIATANELCNGISGIGDTIASRIVEYREIYGDYSSVDDLLIISGISENKLNTIRQYLTV